MNAVPDVTSPSPGTALLPLAERARQALKTTEHERKLLELAEASKSITAITNPAGREQCHSARMALKRVRVDIEKTGKAAREEATAFSKAVIAEERRLISLTEPEEQRLSKIQSEYDERIAAEKRAKAEAEAKRVAAIKERIDNGIRGAVLGAVGRPSAEIERIIADIETIAIDHMFAEFQKEAEGAKATTLIRLRVVHTKAVEAEAEARRLEQERAAQEAERQRLARERAEQEAAAAKERARIEEENRQARLKREAEEREHQAQLQRQREEEERQAAERRRLLEEKERAAAQRRETEEARLAAERAEVERQQEALRLQQEALAKPSDPVEATRAEDVTLVVTEGLMRPSDAEIIDVVAEAFEVSAEVAAGWIGEMGICRSGESNDGTQ